MEITLKTILTVFAVIVFIVAFTIDMYRRWKNLPVSEKIEKVKAWLLNHLFSKELTEEQIHRIYNNFVAVLPRLATFLPFNEFRKVLLCALNILEDYLVANTPSGKYILKARTMTYSTSLNEMPTFSINRSANLVEYYHNIDRAKEKIQNKVRFI